MTAGSGKARSVRAVHGRAQIASDPAYIKAFAAELREKYPREHLLDLYARFAARVCARENDCKLGLLLARTEIQGGPDLSSACAPGV